ncbi:PREDICTED: interferon-inducible GTPase 1-like [Chinchilla lanigera]|uniref:interferon-inducible GTPase 1-like n=1 Tax=Chinchilla lanigera TaxID=34839 RepID=UPI000696A214|nr:PREDICTED: interferon-inducible GTPase 1-like [Chinchilla lanigera]
MPRQSGADEPALRGMSIRSEEFRAGPCATSPDLSFTGWCCICDPPASASQCAGITVSSTVPGHASVLFLHTVSIEGGTSACYSLCTLFKNFKMESQISSQEIWAVIRSHLEEGDVRKAASAIKAAWKDIENAPLSIAVIGETGAGTSTFINALRGMGHEEEGVATTGPVLTTVQGTAYTFPKCPGVTLWDLPGLGSTDFQLQKYLNEIADYDLFFIISATSFKYNDIQLAKAIAEMKKKIYFVRTKIDHDLVTSQRFKPMTFNKDEVLQQIQKYCLTQLQEASVTVDKIFFVSSLDVSDYDFPVLETTLLKDLPAHKRHIFMQCLSTLTETTIDQKRDSLKQNVWLEALKDGLFAAIPLVGLFSDSEMKKLEETLALYRSSFGLDDESLEQMAEDLHVSLENLKANLQFPHLLSAESDESLWEKTKQIAETFLAVTGGPIATGLHFTKTFYLQNYFLDTVASDAKALLNKEDLFGDSVGSD